MAGKWNVRCHLSPKFSLRLLTLVLSVMRLLLGTDGAAAADFLLIGEVGGNVTFSCNYIRERTIERLYFQKGGIYATGYHKSRKIALPSWENTRVDDNETAIHMYRLKISDSGDYQCHIGYNNSSKETNTNIRLIVIGSYSKPSLVMSCNDENHSASCLVTCSSHGGYPRTEIRWTISGTRNTSSPQWRVVNNSDMENPRTKLFNSSSTAHFNCSSGELEISCSVGDTTSATTPICGASPKDPPAPFSPVVIPLAVTVLVIMAVIMAVWCCKRRQSRARAAPAAEERAANKEERLILNEGKEAV